MISHGLFWSGGTSKGFRPTCGMLPAAASSRSPTLTGSTTSGLHLETDSKP